MQYTNPQLNNGHYNTKLVCHRSARYEMEWIYTQTNVRSQGSVELAVEEKKARRLRFLHSYDFFTQLVQAYLIVSMAWMV